MSHGRNVVVVLRNIKRVDVWMSFLGLACSGRKNFSSEIVLRLGTENRRRIILRLHNEHLRYTILSAKKMLRDCSLLFGFALQVDYLVGFCLLHKWR